MICQDFSIMSDCFLGSNISSSATLQGFDCSISCSSDNSLLARMWWQFVYDVLWVLPGKSNISVTQSMITLEKSRGLVATTYFVWLPLAAISPLPFVNCMDVYASVLPTGLSLVPTLLNAVRRTFITVHNSFQDISDLTARIEISN